MRERRTSAGPSATPAIAAAATPVPATTCVRRRRVLKCRPYRHAANSGRSGAPMRISSRPSASRARPMLSVETRTYVARNARSDSSIASQRSSSGERFQRPQWWQTTHSRPFAESNARRLPIGKCSIVSFVPRSFAQKRHVEYMHGKPCAAKSTAVLGQWSSRMTALRTIQPMISLLLGTVALLQQSPYQGATTPPSGDTTGYWQQRVGYTIVATLDEAADQASRARRRSSMSTTRRTRCARCTSTNISTRFGPARNGARRTSTSTATAFRTSKSRTTGTSDLPSAPTVNGTARPGGLSRSARQHGRAFPAADAARAARFCPRRLRVGRAAVDGAAAAGAPRAAHSTLLNGIRRSRCTIAAAGSRTRSFRRASCTANTGRTTSRMVVRDDQVLASTGVPVSGDPGWARVSRTGPPRLAAEAYGRSPPAPAATVPEGFRAVRFVAENVHHFAWSASPDYRYEGGSYARAVPRAHFPTWDTVAVHVLYKPQRRHVVGRRTRRRANDLRASVARVDLGAVCVPAAHERAPPRQGRHRVPDDDHGRLGVARGLSSTRPGTFSRTEFSATTSGGRDGWMRG